VELATIERTSPTLVPTILSVFGEAGHAWLDALPALVATCAERWSLRVGSPFPNLSYNVVAPAERADGTSAVLKLGVPNRELATETAALRHFDGVGSCRLLAADETAGALLLERLEPGRLLLTVEDDEAATRIAAEVMSRLWRPALPDHPLPTVARWGEGFERLRRRFAGGTGPLPAPLVERAERLFAELLATSAPAVVLHGDLHHWNVLSAERAPWLAIDPKGVVGEPAYEVGAWLRNPLPGLLDQPSPGRVLARRLDLLAEALGLDRERLRGWGFAQAILSAWWCLEDGVDGWEAALRVAELLADERA
jgi:streptomycin 6-kinase